MQNGILMDALSPGCPPLAPSHPVTKILVWERAEDRGREAEESSIKKRRRASEGSRRVDTCSGMNVKFRT